MALRYLRPWTSHFGTLASRPLGSSTPERLGTFSMCRVSVTHRLSIVRFNKKHAFVATNASGIYHHFYNDGHYSYDSNYYYYNYNHHYYYYYYRHYYHE